MKEKRKLIAKQLTKWTLLILLALFSVFILLVFIFAETLIKQELSDQFKKKTNGVYSINYNDLNVHLLSQSISIDHVDIQKISTQNSSVFKADTLSFNHIDIFKLAIKGELKIKTLNIESPLWNLKPDSVNMKEAEDPTTFIQKLAPLFNRYLKSISIKNIQLTDAAFLTGQLSEKKATRLNDLNFNVEISNFYTDSIVINRSKDFFMADDIFFGIDHFRKLMADSIHELSVKKIQYSLMKENITGTDIQLTPLDSSLKSGTRYIVDIPKIKIESDRLREFFQSDTVQIDSLFLEDAQIQVFPTGDAQKINLKNIKEFDLYQLVKGEITQLNIGYLWMNASKLKIERSKEEKTSTQEFYDLNIELDSFLLNEASYIDPNRILYSTNLNLAIDNYYLLMNDEVHRFDASNIKVCSENNFLSADHLQLKPNQNPSTELTTVDMECDSIRLIDIDLKKLFHKREMPLQSILAYRPAVTINKGNTKRKTQQETNSLLYYFIRNYIKGIYANLVEFDQGKFTIKTEDSPQQTGVISSDFSFRLIDFSLDSISADRTDKLFFATNIDLNFSNYEMKLVDQIHRLKIERVNVSTYQNQAIIRNLSLSPDKPEMNARLLEKLNRSQIYNIRIPYISLNNTNIHQAFFNKKLQINNFSIVEPSIYLEVFAHTENQTQNKYSTREFYELLSNYIENVSIKNINSSNGNIQLITHSKKGKTTSFDNKFSIELENFILSEAEIDKNRLLFSDDFELKIEDHLFQLSDNVHYLQASEIGISSKRSEIFVKNAILYPDIRSKTRGDLPMHFHIDIPEIKLQGVDLEEAYFKQRIVVDRFSIMNPVINLYRTKGQHKQIRFKNIAVPLPTEMHTLIIKQFVLNDGLINITETNKLAEKKILTSKISMHGNNNSLISAEDGMPANFESDNISTTLSQFEFKPDKGSINVSAGKIDFSTQSQALEISKLLLKNRSTRKGQGFQQLFIPELKFEELDIEEILNQKNMQFKSIIAEKPVMTIHANDNEKDNLNLYQLKIPANISPLINHISAQKVKLNDAQLTRLINEQTKSYPLVQVELNEFEIDTIASKDLLGAKYVQLNLYNHSFTDPDKYYDFRLGSLNFTNQNNRLSISNIQILPLYSVQGFQNIIPYEADYYRGSINQIIIQNIDLKRWYNKHELTASAIIANGGELSIYRDKRTANDTTNRSMLPQEIIKNIELPFYFDSITVRNYNIHYSEQTEKIPQPGYVDFKHLNVSVFPVTNLPYMLNLQPNLTIKANGFLMGEAFLETTMNYDMRSAQNNFDINGQLHPFDMTMLNPIVENTAGFSVRSGLLNRFEFSFEANQAHAHGKLRFAYDDLKVTILENKNGDTKEAKFASFIANSLMLKSKHPKSRILLPDEISFDRDPQKSIVNYWWKSIFSGAKNTFGIKEHNK